MPSDPDASVSLTVEDRLRTSTRGLILAYAAMAPIVAGALAAGIAPGFWALAAARATVLWAGAILVFLSGVRRGLSFRAPGGAGVAPIATMLSLFLLGFSAQLIEATLAPGSRTAVMLLIAGYALLLVLDPMAARREEIPPFLARLRPLQMLLAVTSLLLLLYLRF